MDGADEWRLLINVDFSATFAHCWLTSAVDDDACVRCDVQWRNRIRNMCSDNRNNHSSVKQSASLRNAIFWELITAWAEKNNKKEKINEIADTNRCAVDQ